MLRDIARIVITEWASPLTVDHMVNDLMRDLDLVRYRCRRIGCVQYRTPFGLRNLNKVRRGRRSGVDKQRRFDSSIFDVSKNEENLEAAIEISYGLLHVPYPPIKLEPWMQVRSIYPHFSTNAMGSMIVLAFRCLGFVVGQEELIRCDPIS